MTIVVTITSYHLLQQSLYSLFRSQNDMKPQERHGIGCIMFGLMEVDHRPGQIARAGPHMSTKNDTNHGGSTNIFMVDSFHGPYRHNYVRWVSYPQKPFRGLQVLNIFQVEIPTEGHRACTPCL